MWLSQRLLYSACPSGHDRKNENCSAFLADLSKAFDWICHHLFIAKLNASGFDRNALRLIYNYLGDRSQKIKVAFLFSAYLDITYVVP